MGIILDTNVFIKAEKELDRFDLASIMNDDVYICSVSVSELLVGVHMANNKDREIKRRAFVERVLDGVSTLPLTAEIARVHAELHAQLLKSGKMIGAHDLIIASTAIYWDYSLLSFDAKDFKKIAGLQLVLP